MPCSTARPGIRPLRQPVRLSRRPREACGACHIETIEAAERSLMSTGAMFWGGGAYNNGILPFKTPVFGEAYTRNGEPAKIVLALHRSPAS
jgi:hypothetical protein